jgi:hypothetical protein
MPGFQVCPFFLGRVGADNVFSIDNCREWHTDPIVFYRLNPARNWHKTAILSIDTFSGIPLKSSSLIDLLCGFRDFFPSLPVRTAQARSRPSLLKRKFPHEPVIIFQP